MENKQYNYLEMPGSSQAMWPELSEKATQGVAADIQNNQKLATVPRNPAGWENRVPGSLQDDCRSKTIREHSLRVSNAARKLGRLKSIKTDRDLFMQGACSMLVESGAYLNAWIALFDAANELITWAESGWDQNFLPMAQKMKNKEDFLCKDRVLRSSGFLIVYEPSFRCNGCPLSSRAPDCAAMSAALKHEDSIFGLMTVSVPKLFATSKEAHDVFLEITADIASAILRFR